MSTRSRRGAAGKSSAASSSSAVTSYSTPRQSKYPPWTQLPYLILLEVFRYAAAENHGNSRAVDHAWLYKTAFTCKAFFEPAINLLYGFPPTTPVARLRKLIETVVANPNLGEKVRVLESTGAEILDSRLVKSEIENFVRLTPNVREICISTESQNVEYPAAHIPGYMMLFPGKRLDIPPALLVTLEEMKVQLRNWTWDARLCTAISSHFDPRHEIQGGQQKKKTRGKGFGWLDAIHKDFEAFKTLRSLTLSNFDTVDALNIDESTGQVQIDIATLAGAIGRLKYLRNITIKQCSFVSEHFMSQIAGVHHLKKLVLDGLRNVHAGDLKKFLQVGGKDLEELEVLRCPDVMLGFLSELDTVAPKLRRLFFEDVPGMLDDEQLSVLDIPMPHWPATLESLVMRSLGNWKAVDCEAFLRSLVNTAREAGFMALREIDIWCILPELGWRDRATSRRYWGDEFAMAFLDRRGSAWNEFLQKKKSEGQKIKVELHETAGLCQKVLFRLDDSRPTGNQLNEDDFLDLSSSSKPAKRTSKKTSTAGPSKTKGKGKATTAAKIPSPKKASPTKKKRSREPQSFVVGRKRARYNSDEDEDFKVDQLAYEDEDGEDSSWSFDENE
ncbi:hypothetical protein H072_1509 [Dactylellina haptotyla CBS 200.50]|uniref:F-box domain-containing protein n=1 Tax=Dactylellina haptotyla (strain CBS 200.50) TaxID=1284197 RepID=S8ANF0_DACHA|nr:hypothetical protein H072_1509 [Dactylellina haptotyla CBS 200.50]